MPQAVRYAELRLTANDAGADCHALVANALFCRR
jgi:hypothetical protein